MAWHANPDGAGVGVGSLNELGLAAAGIERRDWSDEQLMSAIADRDEQAFDALYDRYADLVYSAAIRIVGDPGLAEDIAQDIFVRLWRRPESYTVERGRFLSWFMSVVRNRSVDDLRSRGRRRRHESLGTAEMDEEALAATPSRDGDPLAEAQLGEARHAVRGALLGLPREQRVALELAYFGGLTQQEIATALHEPLGTVKTRIRLGMQKLRRSLQGRV